jgi:hypothetical protein
MEIGNGQRNAPGMFRQADNDEPARLADGRDARSVDVQPRDIRA